MEGEAPGGSAGVAGTGIEGTGAEGTGAAGGVDGPPRLGLSARDFRADSKDDLFWWARGD